MIRRILERIDGRGYKAYKELAGAREEVDGHLVVVDRVQGDPFAPPSIIRVETQVKIPRGLEGYPVPVEDFLLRRAHRVAGRYSMRGVGEGHSGLLRVPRPGPVILRRSAVHLGKTPGGYRLTLRLWLGLPSRRRRILGGVAGELLLGRVPRLVDEVARALGDPGLRRHVDAWREQEYIRGLLGSRGLVSFIGDGSVLPRACGGCEEPLQDAIPFESPPSLRVEFELPTGRVVSGMGLRTGLTLIAGPAFYGKTTLLEAIAHGVWDHVPGDGRELVVTRRDAVWIQSENGRWVSCVDMGPWVERLPGLRDPGCWSTSDASGATSAIASVQEAVEAGARVLLIDEDWTATNFIHRDRWTEEVTGKRTLLSMSDLAPALKERGVSVVIVASGSTALLQAADTVIVMDEYRARDATGYALKARRSLAALGGGERVEYRMPRERRLVKPLRLEKPKLRGTLLEARNLRDRVDLSGATQLEEEGQASTVVAGAEAVLSKTGLLASLARSVADAMARGDWGVVQRTPGPGLVEVRWLDILYLVNRIPGLHVVH